MPYTVKQLAKLSGVSVRALHHYDEIGLLKPAYYGDNKYRYYEHEQLLILQQILFYRELEFPLADIKQMITSDSFSKVEALLSHKTVLQEQLKHVDKLLKTIDKTIAHLRGEVTMEDQELYYGFESERQKQYEKQLVENGVVDEETMETMKRKAAKLSGAQKEAFIDECKAIIAAFVTALEQEHAPDSDVVQALARRHYTWILGCWTPTKKSYLELSEMYQSPAFAAFYAKHHVDLLPFLVEAMRVFADNELE